MWGSIKTAMVASAFVMLATVSALAQAIGGNASLSVSTSSSNVAFTGNLSIYPSVVLAPAFGTTEEIFYQLGSSTVTATTTGPALPSGGICVNIGPSTNVAAITSTGSATLRITQLSTCAPFSASSGSGGGGGSGCVGTSGTPCIVDTNASGNLYDAVTAGAVVDNNAFTFGTTSAIMFGCEYATSQTNLTSGNAGAVQCTLDRMMYANIGKVGGVVVPKQGIPVANGGSFYEAVAASQTATVLQSSTGAAGDYLSHCVIYPTSTSPGVVTVFDSTNTAANSAILFPGGSSSLSNLVPISVPVGAVSVNGAWKVTTGASVSVVCYGKFS